MQASSAGASFATAERLPLPTDEYMCIEYPGVIKNIDRALETLGGKETIQAVRLSNFHWC